MKPPLFVRPLAEAERAALRQGLRSPDAFTLRRCQILLASDQGQRPAQIAAALGCAAQTVRNALHAFAAEGLDCLQPKSTTPKTVHAAWPEDRDDDLRALLHQQPAHLRQADQPVDAAPWSPRSATRRAGPPRRSAARRSAWP